MRLGIAPPYVCRTTQLNHPDEHSGTQQRIKKRALQQKWGMCEKNRCKRHLKLMEKK